MKLSVEMKVGTTEWLVIFQRRRVSLKEYSCVLWNIQ